MKLTIFTFFIVAIIGISSAADIYDFKLKDIDNKRISWSQVKGEQVTVIDFWATWCKPCIKSIPKLISIYDDFSDKGVVVLGINVDNPGNSAKVKPFVHNMGISYPVLLDVNSEVMASLNVSLLPTLLLVNVKDQVVYRHQGYRSGDEKIIREEIEKLLGKVDEEK